MAKDVFTQAIQHHEAGRLNKAEKLYKNILKANPSHVGALNLLGVVSYQSGRHAKAAQLLEKAVAINPSDAYAQFNLGNIYKYRGQLVDAERVFRRAAKLNPKDLGVWTNLGIVLQEQSRPEEARGIFEQATALAPTDPDAQFNLGNVLLLLGEVSAAENTLKKAVELRPDFAEAHGNLGNIYLSLRQYEKAITSLNRALALESDLVGAYANLGTALNETGKFVEAVAVLETAIRLDGNLAEVHNSLGAALKNMHHLQAAATSFRRAMKLRPDFTEAHINLATVLFRQENLDDAVAILKAVLKRDSKNLEAIRTLADLWERANRPEEARPLVEFGLALAPKNSELNLIAAKCERRAGKREAAVARLNNIVRESPERRSIGASFELGRLHDEADNASEAFSCFVEGNELSRAHPLHAGVDKNHFLDMLGALDKALSEDWIASWSVTPALTDRPAPIFLFGFPRTGTTLIEQVLASHPDIVTLDEQPAVDEMLSLLPGFPDGYPQALGQLTPDQIEAMRVRYFETADAFLKGASGSILIDKMPLNIVHVAMIWRVFPGAKMILSLRHPHDVCLSCFMQNFEIGSAMASFFTLKDAAHLYAKVMTLWRRYEQALPLDCHVVKYEDFVDDYEGQSRLLLEFLGSDWREAMSDYTVESKRRARIATVSYDQVVQPIYKRARYRWERYRNEIGTSLDSLESFVNSLGY